MSYLAQFAHQSGLSAKARISAEKCATFLNNFMRLMDVKTTALSACGALQSEVELLFAALDHLSEHGEHITVAETARRLNVSMPSVSRTLKNLEEKGLIERDTDKNDRRSVRIIVTKEGDEKMQELLRHIFSTLDTAVEEFSDDELSRIVDLHDRFVNSLITSIKKQKGDQKGE